MATSRPSGTQLLIGACIVAALIIAASAAARFSSINGLLCIQSQFVENRSEAASDIVCANMCGERQRCQAFSMANGLCQLFVFDACSKNVSACNCTRWAQVFVRQQPGLPPGALCPAGYADDRCGAKYKTYPGITSWNTFKATVEAEAGLVIMADVVDSAELSYKSLYAKYSMPYVYIGGWQLPGSAEPAGGWIWISCGTNVSSGIWNSGEPNNNEGTENFACSSTAFVGIIDVIESATGVSGGIGKCVSPFG